MNKLIVLLFLPVLLSGQPSSIKDVTFTHKEFKNLVHYFKTKEELKDDFNFKKGDVIADIGAGAGKYEGALSLLYDSLIFYVQDIDTITLNTKELNKTVAHYNKLRGKPQTNEFHLCIGTDRASNLPNTFFDKIISFSSIHEFTYMDEMIADIFNKIKPGGQLYIADAPCTKKGHKNYSPDEVTAIMKKHGFTLIKMHIVNADYHEPVYRAIFLKPE